MKMRLKFLLSIVLFGTILIQNTTQEVYCPSYTASYLPESENFNYSTTRLPSPTCESCPANCIQCSHTVSKSLRPVESFCQSCDVGYYLVDYEHPVTKNIVQKCEKCSEHCASCTGPSDEQCVDLRIGWQNQFAKKVQCSNNCQKCLKSRPDVCVSCGLGYKVDAKTGKCIECQKKNCSLCMNFQSIIFHDFMSFEMCSTCKNKFGFVDGKQGTSCDACSPGCVNCNQNSKICTECGEFYYLNPETSQCETKKLSFGCYNWDFKTNQCQSCRRGFFLIELPDALRDTKKIRICRQCSQVTYGCESCRALTEAMIPKDMNFDYTLPAYRRKSQCVHCIDGYYYSYKENRCLVNPQHCERATSWVYGDKDRVTCQQCVRGYGFNKTSGKCEKHMDKLKNCMYSFSEEKCSQCEDGYYANFTTGECKKCHASCPSCYGPNEIDCSTCSFKKFKLPSKTTEGKIWFPPTYKCVDSCDVTHNGKKYRQSNIDNVCLVKESSQGGDNPPEPKEKYQFKVASEASTGKELITELESNLAQLKSYTKKDKEERSKAQGTKHLEKSCSYLGRLREELGEDQETTFACDCLKNGFGRKCQYNIELFNAWNTYLSDFLKRVSFIKKIGFQF